MAKSKRKSEDKKIRVTIDFSEQSYERLERLEKMIDAASKADVIRQALRLLEFVSEKHAEGYSFHMKAAKGDNSQVLIPLVGIAA